MDPLLTVAWRDNRAYLVDLAYRMLGDVGDAEDAVQEAFARLAQAADDEIDDARGWLTVVTSRICLDQLKSARTRRVRPRDPQDPAEAAFVRHTPVGQEPAVDPADRITLNEDVRAALFAVLQRLSPAEQVAFVMHDVFAAPFDVVAETLGKPEATCRQLARRARQRLAGTEVRVDVDRQQHQQVTERFMAACSNGDVEALVKVLHPDVWGRATLRPGLESPVNHGPVLVAGNLIRFFGKGATLVTHPLGGVPTLLVYVARAPAATITLDVRGERVQSVQVVLAPGYLDAARS